jgi:peptide/nickel transport system ATP-binding protein
MTEGINETPVIRAEKLSVEYKLGSIWINALLDIDLVIYAGQIHGLVGESGSGKSTLALALMRYLASNARIASGSIWFEGDDLTAKSPDQMRQIWGKHISVVPQDALAALNPAMRIGEQIAEVVRLREPMSRQESYQQAADMLRRVKIADAESVANLYPHQLSGGMQQRVTIAMALIARPRLLILDEPTTSLDVTTQAAILDLARELIHETGAAALYVSHDLGLIAQLCDHVTVLYGGEVMASAPVVEMFKHPLHPYTISLLASLPRLTEGVDTRLPSIEGVAPSLSERSPACVFVDRCPAATAICASAKPVLEMTTNGQTSRCHRWREIAAGTLVLETTPHEAGTPAPPMEGHVLTAHHMGKHYADGGMFRRTSQRESGVHALNDVSLMIRKRSTLGVVGESGSGKTTLARCIIALETADSGDIELLNIPLSLKLSERTQDMRRNMQMIFQNPNDALNPYRSVGEALARTIIRLEPWLKKAQVQERVLALLEAVRLTPEYSRRFPSELSGGEKQRVGVARAFATNPALVLADEPTSALDVSVQAAVLNLLKDLRAQEGASYLFISHDLRAVSYLADWVIVMYLGQIVEVGDAYQVYHAPSHPYTEALISALAVPDPTIQHAPITLQGDPPSPRHVPSGCPFNTRCPRKVGAICETTAPPWYTVQGDHAIRCHIPPDELERLQTSGNAQHVQSEAKS